MDIQDLPSGWQYVPLGQALEIQYGKGLPKRDREESGSVVVYGSNGAIGQHTESITKGPTIIIGRKGSVGEIHFCHVSCWPIDTTFFIDQFPDGLDPQYLYRFLQSQDLRSLNIHAAIPGIRRDDLYRIQVPLPYFDDPSRSLKIQRRIVARIETLLTELAEARRFHTAIDRDVERLMDSVLWEAFGEIREGFNVSGMPSEEIVELGRVCQLRRGKFAHRPRNDPRFFGGSVPWVQIGDIPKDYSKYITTHMDTLNEDGLSLSRLFPKGTIVISIAATIGAVGVLSFSACFPDSLVGITPNAEQTDPGFLYWQLCFMRSHLESVAPYAAQRNINLEVLHKIELWVPSLRTQWKINNHLDQVQAYVTEMRKIVSTTATRLEQLEQAILAQAFRGEI